jgi:hypothetical protein
MKADVTAFGGAKPRSEKIMICVNLRNLRINGFLMP